MRKIDFLEATAAVGHVGDPGIEDARNASELIDDLIDELVRDASEIPHSPGVAFTDPFFVLIDIEKTQFDGDLVTLNVKPALYEAFGADRRPIFEVECAERNPARLGIFNVS